MNLAEAPFGLELRVKNVSGAKDSSLPNMLDELGIGSGEILSKLHSAPLGDPVAISVQGQTFTLRREVLQEIEVELCDQ
jgi:Fe2+ transport system protein FeoA